MSKYKIHTCFNNASIYAEVDTFEEMQKVVESVQPLSEPKPKPKSTVYLDATGKEFDIGSLLAFEASSGGFVIVYIQTTEWCSKTNRWEIRVNRLDAADNGYIAHTIKGEIGKPHPQLFKLEGTFQEYMDAPH